MAKNLMMTIQVKLVQEATCSPELLLLNFYPLTYHHSHFLATTFDFATFSPCSYLKRGRTFFYSVDVLE